MRVPFVLHLCQHVYFLTLTVFVYLVSGKFYLVVVLIFMAEHLFICFLASLVSSSVNCLCISKVLILFINVLIHSTVDRRLICIIHMAIVNNALNILWHVFWCTNSLISLEYTSGHRILWVNISRYSWMYLPVWSY